MPQLIFERSRWYQGHLTTRACPSEVCRQSAEHDLEKPALTLVEDFAQVMICGLKWPLGCLLPGGPGADAAQRGGGHCGEVVSASSGSRHIM